MTKDNFKFNNISIGAFLLNLRLQIKHSGVQKPLKKRGENRKAIRVGNTIKINK